MTHLESIIIAALAVLAYSMVSIRFSRAVQPLRVRVVEDIESLCSDPHVPDDVKRDLETLADNLFSKLNGWLIVLLFPFVMAESLFKRDTGGRMAGLNGKARSKVTQTIGMGLFCMIATSPLCTVIFAVEFIVSMIIATPWGWIRSVMRVVSKVDQSFASFFIFAR